MQSSFLSPFRPSNKSFNLIRINPETVNEPRTRHVLNINKSNAPP